MSTQADQLQPRQNEALRQWSLSRIDVRSPVLPSGHPTARVELEHPVRGRVTEIGTAPGAFDAVFVAAAHILDIKPRLLSYRVTSAAPEEGKALGIQVEIGLELDGRTAVGVDVGEDLVRCSLAAWLDAAAQCSAG